MPRQKSTHVDNPEAVGRRLREARERQGLSQRELAFPGCSPAYISRIEKGDRIPSLQLLRELGRRLGVSADFLATGDDAIDADPLFEAELALRLDEHELAEHLFTQALEGPGDRIQRGRALGGLGQIAFRAGELDTAIERLAEGESLLGDGVVDHSWVTEALGRAYAIRGEYESSIAVFERALERARRRGDELAEARFSVWLANALIDAGSFGRAEELLGGALAASSQRDDPVNLARLYWSQSRLHTMQGSYDVAARYARQALAMVELTENALNAARAHHLLAYIELERGNADEALDLLRKGLPLVRRSGERFEIALFELEEARALVRLGRADEARDQAERVLVSLDGISAEDAGRAFGLIAEIVAETGDRPRAIELYQLGLDKMEDSPLALESLRRLAELLEGEGRREEAFEVLKQAVSVQGKGSARLPAN